MNKKQLFEMLAPVGENEEIYIAQIYENSGPTKLTSVVYGGGEKKAILTDENLD